MMSNGVAALQFPFGVEAYKGHCKTLRGDVGLTNASQCDRMALKIPKRPKYVLYRLQQWYEFWRQLVAGFQIWDETATSFLMESAQVHGSDGAHPPALEEARRGLVWPL